MAPWAPACHCFEEIPMHTTPNPLTRAALALSLGLAASATTWAAAADDTAGLAAGRFEVTVTNLTRGQQFTPLLLVSHKPRVSLFTLGQPAIAELGTLAESGNPAPLAALLSSNAKVGQVVTGSGLTNPGASTTLMIDGRGGFNRLSLAAMLIPTNDGFVAADSVDLPKDYQSVSYTLLAYDAGTERNDETCASIPGPNFPECGGPGSGGSPGGGEGFVHVHAGMHGVGDFAPANRDWRNPVARVTIRRLH
jgi:hypothetical protein